MTEGTSAESTARPSTTTAAAAVAAAEDAEEMLSFPLFQTLHQAQSFHGIPLQDYEQYRQYCTKRLSRIRHHKEVRHILTHNAKYRTSEESAATATTNTIKDVKRGKNAFCPRQAATTTATVAATATATSSGVVSTSATSKEGTIPHVYLLHYWLFQAERAWAQACAAQQQQQQQQQQKSSRYSPHGTAQRRFNKAVKWAQTLADSCLQSSSPTVIDETTRQESLAYLHWMKGNQALERRDHAMAFRQYSACRNILLHLATKASTIKIGNQPEQEQQEDDTEAGKLAMIDLWMTRAETVLKPLIRFCQYEAKDTLDPSEIAVAQSGNDGTSSQNKPSSSSSGISLEFRNKTVDLEGYPKLAVLYLKMEDALANAAGAAATKDEESFYQLLTDLEDALALVATESSRFASLPAGPAVTAKRSELATLKCFFTYHKLQLQRKHQEDTLLGEEHTASDADLFHFYDALQQNAQAVADLAGESIGKDEGEMEQEAYSNNNVEDDPHWLEAQAHVVRIRAFRCYYLACLYETVLNGTSAQVLALLVQARMLQRRAAEEVAACELDDYLPGLEDLKSKIATMQCRVEASRYLELVDASSGIKTTHRPLWQRLQDLDAGPVLADDPPVAIPLPCKPAFFDMAGIRLSEMVPLDAVDAYIRDNEPKLTKSGGFFGWFSS